MNQMLGLCKLMSLNKNYKMEFRVLLKYISILFLFGFLMAPSAHIVQQNLHKGVTMSPDLYTYLQEQQLTNPCVIAALQEPHVASGRVTTFPDRNLIYFRNCTGDEVPRAALYVSNGIKMSPMPAFMDADMATGLWTTNDNDFRNIVVTSIYMAGDKEVTPLFEKLIKFCRRKRLSYILLGDYNAHTPMWGELKTDERGKIMEDFIMQYDLTILNRGERPHTFTWKRGDKESIIDISFCSRDLKSILQNWFCQWKTICDSDHSTITFDVSVDSVHYTYSRNLRKLGWTKFSRLVEEKCEQLNATSQTSAPVSQVHVNDIWSEVRLEKEAQSFSDDIVECLDVTHPKKKIPTKLPDLKWFDNDVSEAKSNKKSAHNTWRNDRSEENYLTYTEMVALYRSAIRKARRASWKKFADNQNDFESVARFNKILNRDSLNGLGQLKDEDGEPCSTVSESLDVLLRSHFPSCTNRPMHEWEPNSGKTCNIEVDEGANFVTLERLEEAIKSFGEHKAAGMDDIKPLVLQKLGDKAKERMLKLFKASMLLGYIPKCWRESRVIFIPKPGKSDYSDPRSFRPISLMTFILKTLERITLWHLQEVTFTENPFNSNQHAFLKGRSTDSALSNMTEYIESALIKKQFALAVFLDVKGAFDHAQTKDMLKGLRDKNAPIEVIKWYEHCLNHRKITLDHQGHTMVKYPARGTPQGGVLSPVMWNVVFDSLLDLFPEKGRVKIVGFADDGALVVTGPQHNALVGLMQKAINRVLKWGDKHGLVFELSKSVGVTFTHKKVKLKKLTKVRMGNHTLKYKTSVKYLGVELDYRLDWSTHVTQKINKAKKLLYKVRSAAGKLWGLGPRMSVWFYRAIVRPMLAYGALVWAKVTQLKAIQKKLRRLQRLALMAMGHFYKSTPTAGLEVATFTAPLWLHIRQEGAMAWLRTKFRLKLDRKLVTINKRSPKKLGHRQYIEKFMNDIGYVDQTSDAMAPVFNWDRKYVVDESSYELGMPDLSGDVTIYTDGSKNAAGMVGSGVATYYDPELPPQERFFHLGKYLSVFQSEVYALEKAVEEILNAYWKDKRIIIHTDSRSALQALTSNVITSKQVWRLRSLLEIVCRGNDITLRWIKAHADHVGNEKADELAKKGANEIDRTPSDIPCPSATAIRKELRKKVVKQWQHEWDNNHPCRQTKHFFPKIERNLAANFTDCNRKVFSAAIQLVTGHNWLNRHRSLARRPRPEEMDSDDETVAIIDALCRYCQEDEESSYHIFAKCPRYARVRREIFGSHELDQPFKFKPIQLFRFINDANMADLNENPNPTQEDASSQA